MRVWLVTIGEPVPVGDGTRDRLHRAGYLAHALADDGHDVVWWTSTFDHNRKRHWWNVDTDLAPSSHLKIRMLHGCGYRRHVSLARLRDHRQIAHKFSWLSDAERPPDIILCSLPTIELSYESVIYGERHGVPVVLDMRDMWPDIFVEAAPRPAQPIARLMLVPMFRMAHRACAGAVAITGHTEGFVDWGVRRAGRARRTLDKSFPFGYVTAPLDADEQAEAEDFWDGLGIRDDQFTLCFIGTVNRQWDLRTGILAVRELYGLGKPVRLIVCGTGDMLDHYKRLAAGDPGVVFPGWVNAAQIRALMRRSSVGLDPLPDSANYHNNINNKAVEYLSSGLPLLCCPNRGQLHDMVTANQCGVSYPHGDVNALTAAISQLINHPERQKSMAANSIALFNRTYRAEKVCADMAAYLEAVIAATGCGRS